MYTIFMVASALLAIANAAPMSTADLMVADDFAANIAMTSGASQFVVWVPTDGYLHAFSGLTCLNVGASSTGSCSITSIDQIAALNGYTCYFEGVNGWSATQTGTSGSAWVSVAPPQGISSAACIPN